MPDVSVALDAAARRHQVEADALATGIEMVALDLFVRLGPQANVADWVSLSTQRLEAGATSYANLATNYTRTQLTLLSPDPPFIPPADLSWVRGDLDHWLPAPMVEVAARIEQGENVNEVLNEVIPQVRRQISAFVNQVEARTVTEALDSTEEFVTFDGQRPTLRDLRDADIARGITDLENFANKLNAAGYRVSKHNGKKLRIQIMPQIGACGWCVVRADRLYTFDALEGHRIRSHTSCRCGWRMVTKEEAQSFRSVLGGDKARWKDVIDRRASPDPNVPSEGDIGP